MVAILAAALLIHAARIPIAILRHGLRVPVGPGAELSIAPPFRHAVVLAQPLPVSWIRTFSDLQRRQVPDIGRQAQVAVADNYPIDVHWAIVGSEADGQRGVGGNGDVNDGMEKGVGQSTRGMDVHLARRLVIDRDTDRAYLHRSITDR